MKGAMQIARAPDRVAHSLLDMLVDGCKPALDELALEIADVEQGVLQHPDKETFNRILQIKKKVLHLRQIIGPQSEVLARERCAQLLNAAHQSQVGFFDRVGSERLAQAGGDLRRQGEKQDAAGGAVQTVHGKHVHAQLVAHAHHGHIAFARPSAMDGQSSGFVYRDQGLVTKENGQGTWHGAQPITTLQP